MNFIISDAIYESGSGDSNNELFIVGENLEEFVSKYKLFGLFANKFNYYSTVLKSIIMFHYICLRLEKESILTI